MDWSKGNICGYHVTNQENRKFMSEDVMESKYKTGLTRYSHSAKLAEWLTYLYQLLSPQIKFNHKISFSIQLIKLYFFNFLFSMSSRPVLGPTHPPIQWIPEGPSLGIKQPGHNADH
jgi:hypothetical protein